MIQNNSYTPDRLAAARFFRDTGKRLFFDVRLEDLSFPSGLRSAVKLPEGVRFAFLVCQDDVVNAAAEPCRLLPDRTREPLTGKDFQSLKRLFPALPILPWPPEEKEPLQDPLQSELIRSAMTADSGWRYCFRTVNRLEAIGLQARLLVRRAPRTWWNGFAEEDEQETEKSNALVPTALGLTQGLTEGYFPPPDAMIYGIDDSFEHILGCTEETWKKLQAARSDSVPWDRPALEDRLELLQEGLPSSPGYSAALVRKMADLPMSSYIARCKLHYERQGLDFFYEDTLRNGLGDLSSITYSQAAAKIDRMLGQRQSQNRGKALLWALAMIMEFECP